jgi:hypothetical protein
LWAVPISGFVVAAGGLAWLGRRWVKRNAATRSIESQVAPVSNDELDRALDDELRRHEP